MKRSNNYPLYKLDEHTLETIKEIIRFHGGINIDKFGTIKKTPLKILKVPNFDGVNRKSNEKVNTEQVTINLYRSFKNDVKK